MKNGKPGLLRGFSQLLGRTQSESCEPAPMRDGEGREDSRASSHLQVNPIRPGSEVMDIVQIGKVHPCTRCPAPCCRLILHDEKAPKTFVEFDYIRFALLHGRAEFLITRQDTYSFAYWSSCRHLDESSYQCTVHHTPAQPKTCWFYNPYNCYYKRNFVGDTVVDVLRLNLERFDLWMKELMFDDDGILIFRPTFEHSIEIVKGIPLSPELKLLPEKKAFDRAG